MAARVKLCAIAKNEGAHIVDWVFHHLRFGFDAIEVWVNGTSDGTLRILRTIGNQHPQVTARVADELLEECLANGVSFQHRAYAMMARRARRDGFTHAAFFDLDEFWTPRDLRSPVQTFLPADPDVNVVSFQWALDVPDAAREPFTAVLQEPERLQLAPHVKSIVRLDDSVDKILTHTARTASGRRLLVRDAFTIEDQRAQQWGSLVTREHLVAHWDRLPEAFLLHALNRSATEYVAKLADGYRQSGRDLPYKPNRHGYLASDAPVLSFDPDEAALQDYVTARAQFHTDVDAEPRVRKARDLLAAKARVVMADVAADRELMAYLRVALRGVPAPDLDDRYPGWDTTVEWWVDHTERRAARTWVVGWGYTVPPAPLELALRDAEGRQWDGLDVTATRRPEVRLERGDAPDDCGFEFAVPEALEGRIGDVEVLVRAQGTPFWDARPLPQR